MADLTRSSLAGLAELPGRLGSRPPLGGRRAGDCCRLPAGDGCRSGCWRTGEHMRASSCSPAGSAPGAAVWRTGERRRGTASSPACAGWTGSSSRTGEGGRAGGGGTGGRWRAGECRRAGDCGCIGGSAAASSAAAASAGTARSACVVVTAIHSEQLPCQRLACNRLDGRPQL